MRKELLIIGAGQYGMVAREIAAADGDFGKINFIDDEKDIAIGKTEDLPKYREEYTDVIVAIGEPTRRMQLLEKAKECGYRITTLVHPTAFIAPSTIIQEGCIVEPRVTVNTKSVIGMGSILSAGSVVSHNSIIGKVCQLGTGSVVEANSIVPAFSRIPVGEVFSGVEDYVKAPKETKEKTVDQKLLAWVKEYERQFGEEPSFFM